MKTLLFSLIFLASATTALAQNDGPTPQPDFSQTDHPGEVVVVDNSRRGWIHKSPRSFLSNVGVSADAGLAGIGASVATPLGKHFNLRAGFGVSPVRYTYTESGLSLDLADALRAVGISYDQYDYRVEVNHDIDFKGKLYVPAGHVLVDFSPTKGGFGAFHITAGFYFGGNRLVGVTADPNIAELRSSLEAIRTDIARIDADAAALLDLNISDFTFSFSDINVRLNDDGSASVYAKVNSVRPYLGIGWGNAIPRRTVGFRFDIGAMYFGRARIVSPNADGDIVSAIDDYTLNKILDKAQFWPQLSVSLTFRLLKDK